MSIKSVFYNGLIVQKYTPKAKQNTAFVRSAKEEYYFKYPLN